MTTIVWLENDLRLADNPALHHAAEEGAVVPVFIWSPADDDRWALGGAHRWWLHHSLYSLASDLEEAGSSLVIREGAAEPALRDIIEATGASRVCWNERYEPFRRNRDDEIERVLTADGIDVVRYQSTMLHDPDQIRTGKGDPYRVFSPFWKKFLKLVDVPSSLPAPDLTKEAVDDWPDSKLVDDLQLLPDIDWAGGLREAWTPGEQGALQTLDSFIDESITSYHDSRNFPSSDGTSRLSPHLRFGEISPRQVWNRVRSKADGGEGVESFLREIGWREFSYHLLYHYPDTTTQPLDSRYSEFPWAQNEDSLRRWQKGKTGYPIVDAGMRQLWHTGWMHNRVRMIVASFLTKDLLIHWIEGARWFWDTLVDGDLANNTQGWQWAAGSGADAQPFFRIFNPVTQGQRYDPDGEYVRKWVPEISQIPDKYLHNPWEAPSDVLSDAGVELGSDYPMPIVDHAAARKRALAAFEDLR